MVKDELIKGGITLFILLNIFNFINYLFHLVTARMLTVVDYGILVTLLAITHYFYVSSDVVNNTISRYTSKFFNNHRKIKDLFKRGLTKILFFSMIAYIIFIPIAIFLSWFLKINFWLVMLTGLLLFGAFATPVIRGILQGKKRFKSLGISMNIEAISKILLVVILIYFVQNIYGVILGIIISVVFGFFISLYFIKDILKEKGQHADIKGIYSFGSNTFVASLALILIFGLDIILVKHFFTADIAGQYAVASILAKSVYFASMSISRAMFPISSLQQDIATKHKTFKKTLFIILGICSVAIIAFIICPKLIITILFGAKYVEISSILFILGITFTLRSITLLNILNKMSHGRITNPWMLFIFVVLGIVVLFLFHNSILSFAIALCVTDLIMLLGTFFLKTDKFK